MVCEYTLPKLAPRSLLCDESTGINYNNIKHIYILGVAEVCSMFCETVILSNVLDYYNISNNSDCNDAIANMVGLCAAASVMRERRQNPVGVAKQYINLADPAWVEEKYVDEIKGKLNLLQFILLCSMALTAHSLVR